MSTDHEQASQMLADWSSIALLVRRGTATDLSSYSAATLFRTNREIQQLAAGDDFGAAGTARARLMLERIRCGFAAEPVDTTGEDSESDMFWARFRDVLKDLEGRQGMLSPGIQLLYEEYAFESDDVDVESSQESEDENQDPALSTEYIHDPL